MFLVDHHRIHWLRMRRPIDAEPGAKKQNPSREDYARSVQANLRKSVPRDERAYVSDINNLATGEWETVSLQSVLPSSWSHLYRQLRAKGFPPGMWSRSFSSAPSLVHEDQ